MDILKNHRHFWNDERKQSIFWGVLLLAAAIIIQIFAGHYSSRESIGAPAVGDIFLNNLPVLPLDFVIVIGEIIFWTFSSLLLIFRPNRLLFGIKAIALFIICRAFFMDLTHIGLYPGAASPTYRVTIATGGLDGRIIEWCWPGARASSVRSSGLGNQPAPRPGTPP